MNNFEKPNVLKTRPTGLDMGIIDRENEKNQEEVVMGILEELSPTKLNFTPEEEEEYESLESEEKRSEFLRLKSRSMKYNIMYDSLTDITNKTQEENELDRFSIKPEDIEKLLEPISNEEINKAKDKTYTDMMNSLFRMIRDMYTEKRNRYIDGTLDISIDMHELGVIKSLVNNYFKAHPEFMNKITTAYKVKESGAFFNDYMIESRMRYELNKEIACNVYGITPDSYDEFQKEVLKMQEEYLHTVGVDKPTDLQKVWTEHALKCKHLLKKDPSAREKLMNGERIYQSIFLATADRAYKNEVREALKTSDPKMKQLFLEMSNNLYNDPIEYREKHKSTSKIAARTLHDKSDVQSFMEKAKNRVKSEKSSKIDFKHSPAVSNTVSTEKVPYNASSAEIEGNKSDVLDLNQFINEEKVEDIKESKNDDILNEFLDEKKEDEVKEKEPEKEVKIDEIPEVKEEKVEEDLNPVDELLNDKTEDEKEESLLDALIDKTNEDIEKAKELGTKPRVTRDNRVSEFDSIFTLLTTKPDVSILKENVPTHEKLRKYKESGKYERRMYLPNSNYAVNVKRILNDTQISYMLRLLQDNNDIDSDLTVKFELIKILYEALEFDTPTTFNEFLQNTHESDLTLLFELLALVNSPEVDGKVPVTINYLLCDSCGNIAHLKKPLELDIKSEFINKYPIKVYTEKYNKYLTSDYKTIAHAYRGGSEAGKPHAYTSKDELFEYKVIYSLPTLYKKYITENESPSVSYQVTRESIETQLEDSKTLGPSTEAELIKLEKYMQDHSFASLTERYRDISVLEMDSVDTKALTEEELAKYNEFKEEFKTLETISNMIYNISSTLRPIFALCNVIDMISIKTIEGEIVSSRINHENLYEMVQVITNLPENVLQELSDIVLNQIDEDKKFIIDGDIKIDSSEVKGNIEWENIYQFDNEEGKVVSEEDLEAKWIASREESHEEVTEDEIISRRNVRKLMKERVNNGLCTCGNETFKVNYTNLLFFSMLKR